MSGILTMTTLAGWSTADIARAPSLHAFLVDLPSSSLLPLPSITDSSKKTAFTHKSAYQHLLVRNSFEVRPGQAKLSYDTYETYGDAVLQYSVSNLLSQMYPNLSKGGITDMRSFLVRNRTLARLSVLYDFPEKLVASGYQVHGLRENFDIAANIFESYIWAVKEEHGLEKAETWLAELYTPLAQKLHDDLSSKH